MFLWSAALATGPQVVTGVSAVAQQCDSKLLQNLKRVTAVRGQVVPPDPPPLLSMGIDSSGIARADSFDGDKSRKDVNTSGSC